MWAKALGRGVRNESEFDSLQDIDLTSAEKAQDAMCVIDRALEEVSATRARLGAFQKNNLESNLSYLRYAYENLSKSESVIRDADIADEMTQFTRNQIMIGYHDGYVGSGKPASTISVAATAVRVMSRALAKEAP